MNQPNSPKTEQLDGLLGQIADEILEELSCGKKPDIERYAKAHPELATVIRRTFPALQLVAEPPSESGRALNIEAPSETPLGDFRLLDELGRGGMGVVYEAEQISLGRRVALKVLPFAAVVQDKALQRFRNEVRAAAALDHPNIVSVYSVGETSGVHYYAMQLIRGQTLADAISALQRLDRSDDLLTGDSISQICSAAGQSELNLSISPPTEELANAANASPGKSVRETETAARATTKLGQSGAKSGFFQSVARLGIQAANALQHAHDQGVLHRDIKPGNLMLDANAQLYITDFGLARIEADAGMTMTGDLVGTLRYMSPEQALAKRVVLDQRSDIYSLGVTLYELLTLRPAVGGTDRQETLKQIAFAEPLKPRQLNRSIPRELETIVLKAIEKNPDERYTSAEELAADLMAFLDNRPIKAKPPTVAQRVAKWSRRHRAAVMSGAVLLVLLSIGLGISNVLVAHQRNRANTAALNEQVQREEAERHKKLAEANYRRAREAVDQYLTKVSQDILLKQPGMQQLRKDLLDLALKYYEDFIQHHPDDLSLQQELASAYFRVAKIQEQIASRDDSLQAYRKAEQIRKTLAAKFPNDTSNKHHLATIHLRISHLELLNGEFNDAFKSAERARELYAALSEKEESNPAHQTGLGRAYCQLALLQKTTGKIDDAIASFRKAISIFVQATRADQGGQDQVSDLAQAYSSLSKLVMQKGERDAALQLSQESVELLENLVEQSPKTRLYRLLLGASWQDLGSILRREGEFEKARDSYQKAEAEFKQLVTNNPAVTEYRQALADAANRLGIVFLDLGEFDESFASLKQSVDAKEKLAEAYPNVRSFTAALATGYQNIAVMKGKQRLDEDARSWCLKSLDARQRLVDKHPTVVEYRYDVAVGYNNLGGFEKDLGNHEASLDALEKASQLLEDLAADEPGVVKYSIVNGGVCCNTGHALRRRQELQAALQWYARAIRSLNAALDVEPRNVMALQFIVRSYRGRAAVLESLEQFEAAIDSHEMDLNMRERIVQGNPIHSNRLQVVISHLNLGGVYKKIERIDDAYQCHQNASAVYQQLVENHPDILRYTRFMGGNYCNTGNLLAAHDRPGEALPWYGKAIATLEPLLNSEEQGEATVNLRNTYSGRALARTELAQYAEALADWEQALALSSKDDIDRMAMLRVRTLVMSGKRTEAVAAADKLLKTPEPTGEVYYLGARAFSLISAAVMGEADLGEQEQRKLQEQSLRRTMDLLVRARDAGYFDDAEHVIDLRTEDDFDAIRTQPGLARFIEELEKNQRDGPPPE